MNLKDYRKCVAVKAYDVTVFKNGKRQCHRYLFILASNEHCDGFVVSLLDKDLDEKLFHHEKNYVVFHDIKNAKKALKDLVKKKLGSVWVDAGEILELSVDSEAAVLEMLDYLQMETKLRGKSLLKSESLIKYNVDEDEGRNERAVVCIDNTGMEHDFDKGVSYVLEDVLGGFNYFVVLSKFGREVLCNADRFVPMETSLA